MAQDFIAIFLNVPFLFLPCSGPIGEMATHFAIFLCPNLFDRLKLAFRCSFNAIISPAISPGLWMSSYNFTHTNVLKVLQLLSGSRFVLMFGLHDNCLKAFLHTANISRSSTPLASSLPKLYVPEDGSVRISLF